jgi:glutaconate CoA-transferase, subunit A
VADVVSAAQASARIAPTATVGIGGLHGNFPMATIRALAQRSDLSLDLVGPTVGMGPDLLIAVGAVRRIAAPYMGAEGAAPVAPAYRHAVETSAIKLWECDEGILLTALRAAGQGLPYLPWRGGVGTSIPSLNPELVEYVDQISGQTLLRIPARTLDVALLRALEADEQGNVRYYQHSFFADPTYARAARMVIVEVERMVPHTTFLDRPQDTILNRVDAIVVAPFGSHPFRAAGVIREDTQWIRDWRVAIRDATANSVPLRDIGIVRDQILPASHTEYLERVGTDRIAALSANLRER